MKAFKASRKTVSVIKNKFNLLQFSQKAFSDHSGSGSDTDYHQSNTQPKSFFEEKKITEPWNTWRHLKDEKFEVLSLIERLREPAKGKKDNNLRRLDSSNKKLSHVHSEYCKFLAECFESTVTKKYPEYKQNLEELKKEIPNYDRLNPYEREVKTLDAYMNKQIRDLREETYKKQGFELTKGTYSYFGEKERMSPQQNYEAISRRKELLEKLTHVGEGDTSIVKTIKSKLGKVLNSQEKYAKFLKDYQDELEQNLMETVVEKRKMGYTKKEIKTDKTLKNLESPHNPHLSNPGVMVYDNIKIDDFKPHPDRMDSNRHKYLALYDLVIDQHLGRIRPSNLEDNINEYVNPVYSTDRNLDIYNSTFLKNERGNRSQNEYIDNSLYDHFCRLDGEYYVKFRAELERFFDKEVAEDLVRLYL